MNLLKEGMEQKAVLKTTLTRKLTVDGLTKAYPVYKVKLDWLFYNDQNDRIATWISQYKAQHEGKTPDIAQREAYNNIIEEFIVASNPDAIRKTQSNIELVDQREPGVVLADGRIQKYDLTRLERFKVRDINENTVAGEWIAEY